MVNLYEGLIVAVEVSPRSEPTYRNQHIPVPVIRVPLFPFRYNFPPPRRSPWVTSREHFGGPLSPPRINLWPRKREGDCLCSHALGGLPTTFLRVLHCLDSKRTLPIFGEREGLRLSLSLYLSSSYFITNSLLVFFFFHFRKKIITTGCGMIDI